jgi:hypothetical protein
MTATENFALSGLGGGSAASWVGSLRKRRRRDSARKTHFARRTERPSPCPSLNNGERRFEPEQVAPQTRFELRLTLPKRPAAMDSAVLPGGRCGNIVGPGFVVGSMSRLHALSGICF